MNEKQEQGFDSFHSRYYDRFRAYAHILMHQRSDEHGVLSSISHVISGIDFGIDFGYVKFLAVVQPFHDDPGVNALFDILVLEAMEIIALYAVALKPVGTC